MVVSPIDGLLRHVDLARAITQIRQLLKKTAHRDTHESTACYVTRWSDMQYRAMRQRTMRSLMIEFHSRVWLIIAYAN